MTKLLFVPDYFKYKYLGIFKEARKRGYLLIYFPKDTAIRKIIDVPGIYDAKKIIALASEDEHLWAKSFMEKCSFNKKIVFSVTLSKQENKKEKINKKNLEILAKLL